MALLPVVLRYSDKPYGIYKHSRSQIAEDARKAEKEEQRKKAVAYFNSFAKTPKKL